MLTTFAFGSVTEAIGIRGVLGILSGVIFLTALLTLMIPETKGKSLDEIENDTIYGRSIERSSTSEGRKQTVTASSLSSGDIFDVSTVENIEFTKK